jgi:hypothetical protein
MKILPTIAALAALSFVLGCNRSESDRSSTDVRDNTARASRQDIPSQQSTNLAPTSRDANAPNRTYDTNNLASKDADNTGLNVRDRGDNTLTPGDQGTSESDREITRNIRRAITKNDQLSTTAKNIKIITINGKVTLRGPVANEQEQQAIAAAAQSVAGVGSLDNQLEVKAK